MESPFQRETRWSHLNVFFLTFVVVGRQKNTKVLNEPGKILSKLVKCIKLAQLSFWQVVALVWKQNAAKVREAFFFPSTHTRELGGGTKGRSRLVVGVSDVETLSCLLFNCSSDLQQKVTCFLLCFSRPRAEERRRQRSLKRQNIGASKDPSRFLTVSTLDPWPHFWRIIDMNINNEENRGGGAPKILKNVPKIYHDKND